MVVSKQNETANFNVFLLLRFKQFLALRNDLLPRNPDMCCSHVVSTYMWSKHCVHEVQPVGLQVHMLWLSHIIIFMELFRIKINRYTFSEACSSKVTLKLQQFDKVSLNLVTLL